MKTIFPDELWEDVVVAILVLVSLKSFEFIVKTMLTSTRNMKVNTARYALEIAVDEAFNPLNFWKWYRGSSDFESKNPTLNEKEKRRPIPLSRATLAVLVAVLVLTTEAMFFFFSQSSDRILYHTDFEMTVNSTDTHAKRFEIEADFCTPKKIETRRAQLTSVFAFCNSVNGAKFRSGGATRISFSNNEYSQSVTLSSNGTGEITSTTTFSILVPDHPNHLVVRYNATKKLSLNALREIQAYVSQLGCRMKNSKDGDKEYDVINCQHAWTKEDATKLMTTILQYTQVDIENRDRGSAITVGHYAGGRVVEEKTLLEVGVLQEKKLKVYAIFIFTGALFAIALAIHLLIQNDATAVIAGILRKETGQDISIPAVSMGSHEVQIEFDQQDEPPSFRLSHSVS